LTDLSSYTGESGDKELQALESLETDVSAVVEGSDTSSGSDELLMVWSMV